MGEDLTFREGQRSGQEAGSGWRWGLVSQSGSECEV